MLSQSNKHTNLRPNSPASAEKPTPQLSLECIIIFVKVLTHIASQSRLPERSGPVQLRAFWEDVEMMMEQKLTEYTGNPLDDFRRVSYYPISIYAMINHISSFFPTVATMRIGQETKQFRFSIWMELRRCSSRNIAPAIEKFHIEYWMSVAGNRFPNQCRLRVHESNFLYYLTH